MAYTAPRRLQDDLGVCQFDCILQSPLRLVFYCVTLEQAHVLQLLLNVVEKSAC